MPKGNFSMMNQNTEKFTPAIESRISELMEMSEIFSDFMKVQRATYREGRPETDGEHTVHVMFLAMAYTAKHHPEFNPLEVAVLCLIHDLDEVYVGDVNSLTADDAAIAAKECAEEQSRQLLRYKFADQPFILDLLERYWRQDEAITRFVRGFEKIDPSFAHLRDEGQAIYAMKEVNGVEDLRAMNERSLERMASYATSDVMEIRRILGERVLASTFAV